MKRRITWKTILVIVLAVLLVVGSNIGQYFIWDSKLDTTIIDYNNQISLLEATIEAIGESVAIYTVNMETYPGKEVQQSELEPVMIPASMIGDSYVLDPASVVGKFYKVGVKAGTPLTSDLIMEHRLDDTDREMDIIADGWPVGLKEGDYVDFEITYPMGEKYIVMSHKRIEAINGTAVKMVMNGTERHLYSGVLIDYFLQRNKGATISLVKYTEPGAQKSAEVYYAVPQNILAIILADPNVVSKVDSAINAQRRALIESGISVVTAETGSLIAGGRSKAVGDVDSASKTAAEKERERLEQEALDALNEAAQNIGQPPVTNPHGNDGLNIQEGVVN